MQQRTLFCAECSEPLGTTIYAIVWFGVLYEFCRAGCKGRWRRKKIAHMNMEEPIGQAHPRS